MLREVFKNLILCDMLVQTFVYLLHFIG